MQTKKVLIISYTCSPYRGSEPGAGWHKVVETSKYYETWVICKKQKYEEEINRYLIENGDIHGLHFVFVPRNKIEKILKKSIFFWYLAYNLWHRRAFKVAKKLDKIYNFDLFHQLTLCGYREPGYLWKINKPFVWGPIGGTQNVPFRYLNKFGFTECLNEIIRSIINRTQFKYSPRVRKAFRKSSIVIAANSEIKKAISNIHHRDAILLADTGIEIINRKINTNICSENVPKMLWCGNLIYRKGIFILLNALKYVNNRVEYYLDIVGKGKNEKILKKIAFYNGIESKCNWIGNVSHEDIYKYYNSADIFVFTSLRDTLGTVVLEALSCGLPVICLDQQGAGDIVNESCGIKIKVSSLKETTRELAEAIYKILSNRELLLKLSRGATIRSFDYTWDNYGKKIKEIYSQIFSNI